MAQQQSSTKPEIGIQRLYVKDLSFETPGAPDVFRKEWKPQVNVELDNTHKLIQPNMYEIVLSIIATAKVAEKPAFVVEVKQAGIFMVRNFPEKHLEQILESYCPSMLFPYAREVISDLVTRGSFPQLVLAPMDFNALYEHKKKQKQNQKQDANSQIVTEN